MNAVRDTDDRHRLVDAAGDVRLGIFTEPILEVNHRDYRLTDPFERPRGRLARRFLYHQFQFLGAVSDTLVFGCAIANLQWLGTAFAYCWEPATRRYTEVGFRRPLAAGIRFTDTPEDGAVTFRAGRNRVTMTAERQPRARRLAATFTSGVAIDAVFDEGHPPVEPMLICTRAGAAGWVFARKTAGVPTRGTLTWEGRTFDLAAIGARGHNDWSAGFMRRETFWNWGCIAGTLPDGRSVGMNVSCGVNETSFTESCFWIDGRLHKLDMVAFDYDRRDLMRPWRMRSSDGRLDLAFQPEGQHEERANVVVLASNFHQLFGRYHGRLTTAAGEEIRIDGLLGYAESHYAKW